MGPFKNSFKIKKTFLSQGFLHNWNQFFSSIFFFEENNLKSIQKISKKQKRFTYYWFENKQALLHREDQERKKETKGKSQRISSFLSSFFLPLLLPIKTYIQVGSLCKRVFVLFLPSSDPQKSLLCCSSWVWVLFKIMQPLFTNYNPLEGNRKIAVGGSPLFIKGVTK